VEDEEDEEYEEAIKPAHPKKGKTSKSSRSNVPKAPPLQRARSGGKLTHPEWLELLRKIEAGELRATTEGGAMPRTTALRGTADLGMTPAMQYAARFKAWDAGHPAPAEPSFNSPVAALPPAKSRLYTTHLSGHELDERKVRFVARARDAAEAGTDLGQTAEHSALLQQVARDGVAYIEANMSPRYAAELEHTDEDGTGRERVRQLSSPADFVRDYALDIDPQFFESLGLSAEESYTAHAYVLRKLMLATYATNFEMQRELDGLPYVPFRGVFSKVGGSTFIINEAGHFQAYYSSDLLASEDIAKLDKCETGRGLNQLYAAAGQAPGIAANATVVTDLWRAAADTRVVGADGLSRRTVTPWRRAMVEGGPEPYPQIAQLARMEHACRLLLFLGLGANEERIRAYGEPSSRYTESRLRIPPAEQQDMLSTLLKEVLTSERHAVVVAASPTSLPYVEQTFFRCSHLQNVWANAANIFEVHLKVYMIKGSGELTAEQLERIRHESNAAMGKDVDARLLRARADLAIAEHRFVLALANVRAGPQSPRGNHAPTAEFESTLVELVMRRQAELLASSRRRGGVCSICLGV